MRHGIRATSSHQRGNELYYKFLEGIDEFTQRHYFFGVFNLVPDMSLNVLYLLGDEPPYPDFMIPKNKLFVPDDSIELNENNFNRILYIGKWWSKSSGLYYETSKAGSSYTPTFIPYIHKKSEYTSTP
ncbi:MAG: hypothetical protein ACK4ND_15195, partial [Cytophagaceae bacterium]